MGEEVPVNRGRQIDLAKLRRLLGTHLDEEGLRALCYDLGVDYGDLPGNGRRAKARELLAHMERRARVHEIVLYGRQLRPDVPWSTVLVQGKEAQTNPAVPQTRRIDVAALSQDVAALLHPLLPDLVQGAPAGETPDPAMAHARRLWDRLGQQPQIEQAARDAAEMPGDPDALGAFRFQLRKVLSGDDALAREIMEAMEGRSTQRVLAEGGSQVSDVEQNDTSASQGVRQEVVARGQSTITGVRQIKGKPRSGF